MVDPQRVAGVRLSPFASEGATSALAEIPERSGLSVSLRAIQPARQLPMICVCRASACAAAELRRLGERQAIGVEGLPPHHLYRYEVSLDRGLDPTDGETRQEVGLSLEVLTGPDFSACQELGTVYPRPRSTGLLCPSATGVDKVLAVFLQRLSMGRLVPHLAEEWHSIIDVADGDEGPTA